MSDNKECFFIAPIDEEGTGVRERSNKVMEYIVEEAVSDYGYSVTRADQMDQPGSITNQVIQKTVNSELVIADLTGHNPNVFYELAVRHATGEPYIQLIKLNEPIPFDISDLRTIKYGLEVDDADQAKDQIRGLLEQLEEGEPKFDNPISESAEMQSLRESADPTDQNLAEMLETMYKLDNKIEGLETMIKKSDSKSVTDWTKESGHGQNGKIKTLSKEENKIYDLLRQLEEDVDDSVPKEDLVSNANYMGLSEDEIGDILTELLMDGHIYEAADGAYRTI